MTCMLPNLSRDTGLSDKGCLDHRLVSCASETRKVHCSSDVLC